MRCMLPWAAQGCLDGHLALCCRAAAAAAAAGDVVEVVLAQVPFVSKPVLMEKSGFYVNLSGVLEEVDPPCRTLVSVSSDLAAGGLSIHCYHAFADQQSNSVHLSILMPAEAPITC